MFDDYKMDISLDFSDFKDAVECYLETNQEEDFLTFLFKDVPESYEGNYEKFECLFPVLSIKGYLVDFLVENEDKFKQFIEKFIYEFQLAIDSDLFADITEHNFGDFLYGILGACDE